MPINAGAEYFSAEKKYQQAKTKEEKIAALEEMIRTLPRHKGTENVLARLKKKLSILKSEKSIRASAKPKFSLRKEGAAQICLVGLTNAGKSALLNSLTNAQTKVADHPFTTKEPAVGMMNYGDLQLQIIEIPSIFTAEFLSVVRSCDLIIMVLDSQEDILPQKNKLSEMLGESVIKNKKIIAVANKVDLPIGDGLEISSKKRFGLDRLKERIWKKLNLIRVYTKSPGKEKDRPPVAMKPGSSVKNLAKQVHKDFLKTFKFARIFNETKFSGQRVGLDYKLHDLDVVEIHTE